MIIAVGMLLAAGAALTANDGPWPRFRGPNGAGVSDGAALPSRFGPEEHLIWRAALPSGHSSPVLAHGRVYVTASQGEALVTIALDAATGQVRWRAEAQPRRSHPVDRRNHPASPTPAVDATHVFVFFQDVGLLAYDLGGRERWRLPLGPFDNVYGMGASPIVAGDLVVLVCDQSTGSFMIAVDRDTGQIRWRVERPEATSGHSTPVLYEPPGAPSQLLVPGSFYLTAYDLRTGRKLWWTGGLAFEMKATPVHDGSVVYISGTTAASFEDSYGRNIPEFGAVRSFDVDQDGRFTRDELPDELARRWFRLLDLDGDRYLSEREWTRYREARRSAGGLWAFRLGGTGDLTGSNAVWHYDRSVPQLPSPLLYRNLLYIVNDGGIVTALDPKTGSVAGQKRLEGAADSYYASPVAGDGKIVLISESGTVSVLAAGAELETLATNDLGDLAYATPAIGDGRLFIRTRGALYCFGYPAEPQLRRIAATISIP